MRHSCTPAFIPVRVTLLGALFVPVVAQASGFALLEQSASRLGTAFAGTAAAADDATTIYFNPAGMGLLTQTEALVVGSGIEINSQFHDNGGSAPAFGQPLGNNGGDAGDWNFVPSAYLAVPLADRVTVGLGINAPFGLKLVYDDGWVGRFQALRSDIKTLNFNPALSWWVTDTFAIGIGASYQRIEAELTNAVNYTAVVAQGVQQLVALGQIPAAAAPGIIAANAGLEGGARVRGDDDAWGWNVGLMFKPSDSTRIGLSYRSSITYEVSGTVNFSEPSAPNPVGAQIVAAASASGAPLADGPASVDLELPDSAVLSLSQRFGAFELLADIAWTGWSSVQELRVVRDTGAVVSVTPEHWKDTWRYALGAVYSLSQTFALRAGVAYDETPVPDATRTPRLPDPDRTWVAVGVRWAPTASITVDVGYAHLFSDDAPIDQNEGNTAAYGRVVGNQSSDIDIVSAQLFYRF
jgi:long-chain fatty acid transport protein